MDRRVVAGLAGLVLVGCARLSPAQTGPGKDPSAQPSVGLAPLRSIGDTINNTTDYSGTVPMASPAVPTSPIGTGPAAVIPRPPVLTSPVSMTPLEPIDRSIRADYRQRGISSIFRKPRPQAAAAPVAAPRAMPRAEAAPVIAPPAVPSTPPDLLGSDQPVPAGRPAPFANQVPDQARLQAEPAPSPNPAAVPGAGRLAPLADEIPRSARPRAHADDRPSTPRPQAEPANPPAFHAAEAPISTSPTASDLPPPPTDSPTSPLELPPPPALEAVSPPPIGADPLRGMAVPPSIPPVATPEPAPAPAAPSVSAPSPVDPAVNKVSQDETAVRTKEEKPKELAYVTLRAAAVGDEIITINELTAVVNDRIREVVPQDQLQAMSKSEKDFVKNQIAANALQSLIDQTLILQEAKRQMSGSKNPKALQAFNEYVDKQWKEHELPPLLRKTATANVYELKIKLAEQGKSYDAMKEAFRKKTLARDFMGAKIHDKVSCDLVEQRAYYNQHLDDFVQPARMTWREIEINVAKSPNRAAARKKADDILARLLHDEDFDAVAKSSSDGPTASKGGLYVDMQPGSYGIPVVNDALNRLPAGQVSRVLEAPNSFHIVRIDSRREKGPLRFDEVQDKIKGHVLDRNFQLAVEAYISKLRSRTLVRTMFDNSASDPSPARRKDASVRAVSNPAPNR